jgi:2-polyprenyl-3-methyl-5-hydroxy-6-metoxy-1,4-benzoquinol methylase
VADSHHLYCEFTALPWGNFDIGEEKLKDIINTSENPKLITELASLSRKYFGWYTRQLSRSTEYPWVLQQMAEVAGKVILDLGAGVSPLPIYLAEHGAKVITLDNSQTVRELTQDTKSWSGWGFLDYSKIDPSVISLNNEVRDMSFRAGSFDCVYSVSVIEHIAKSIRAQMWGRLFTWLKKRGRLVLTLDLYPKSDDLWNRSQGKIVEPVTEHGNLHTLLREITKEGFELTTSRRVTGFQEPTYDVMFLSFTKS